MRSWRRPSPEGTRLLLAGTISPVMCSVDGPTEGRHDKTRRKTRKEKKRIEQNTELKKQSNIPISSWWAKDDTSDPNEGRDEEPEKYNNKKTKQKVTNKTKPNSWRPSYCWALSDAAH